MKRLRDIWFAAAWFALLPTAFSAAQGLALRVGLTSGDVFIENSTNATIAFDGYELTSASGLLQPQNLLSIADNYDLSGDQSVDFTSDWFGITASSTSIAEASLVSLSGFLDPGQRIDLGSIFSSSAISDLMFEYQAGLSTFSSTPTFFLEGDLNSDAVVDTADFVSLRDSTDALGTIVDINSDGVIDSGDFVAQETLFGATNATAIAASLAQPLATLAIPEPTGSSLVVFWAISLMVRRRPSC